MASTMDQMRLLLLLGVAMVVFSRQSAPEKTDALEKIKGCLVGLQDLVLSGALVKNGLGELAAHEDCLGFLLSKALSAVILLGAGVVKVFQIVPIINSASAAGLDVRGLYAELTLGISFGMYNFHAGSPFSTYGETVFVFIQNVVLVYLIWIYSRPPTPLASRVVPTALIGAFAAATYHYKEYKDFLPKLTLPLLILMRMPQIMVNFENGHTGQLASVTVIMGLGGSAARVFTTIKELGWEDPSLIVHVVALVLNAVLLLQIIVYRSRTKEVLAKERAKKTK